MHLTKWSFTGRNDMMQYSLRAVCGNGAEVSSGQRITVRNLSVVDDCHQYTQLFFITMNTEAATLRKIMHL